MHIYIHYTLTGHVQILVHGLGRVGDEHVLDVLQVESACARYRGDEEFIGIERMVRIMTFGSRAGIRVVYGSDE